MIRTFKYHLYEQRVGTIKLAEAREFLQLNFTLSKSDKNKILNWSENSFNYIKLSIEDLLETDFQESPYDYISIFDVDDPSDEIKLDSIRAAASSILAITDPTEEMQLLAIQRDYKLIDRLKNPCDAAKILSLVGRVQDLEFQVSSLHYQYTQYQLQISSQISSLEYRIKSEIIQSLSHSGIFITLPPYY